MRRQPQVHMAGGILWFRVLQAFGESLPFAVGHVTSSQAWVSGVALF